MRKLQKQFEFLYPLSHKVVRDLRIVTEHVGDLLISGKGYFNPNVSSLDIIDRFTVDIDSIKWNGTDIKPVVDVAGMIEEIEEAACAHVSGLFELIAA